MLSKCLFIRFPRRLIRPLLPPSRPQQAVEGRQKRIDLFSGHDEGRYEPEDPFLGAVDEEPPFHASLDDGTARDIQLGPENESQPRTSRMTGRRAFSLSRPS